MLRFHGNHSAARQIGCSILLCGLLFADAGADLSARLKTITGKDRVKVVFTRCKESHDVDFPTANYQTDEVLVGFDTEKGKEDTLQATIHGYQNPLITHDGERIVFWVMSDSINPATQGKTGTSYIMEWKKNVLPKKIADGATACLWYDTKKKKEYAIYAYKAGLGGDAFRKVALDNPADDTLLYQGAGNSYWLRVSSDLRGIGGCMGPFSSAGAPMRVYDLVNKVTLVDFAGNCWPTMPYDTTCRLVKTDHQSFLSKNIEEEVITSGSPCGFSQMRMASYSSDIFLVVTDAVADGGENGTGHIAAVKTSKDLSKILDTVCITVGGRTDHHADLWAGPKNTGTESASSHPFRFAAPDPNSKARIFTLSGRCIATVSYGKAAGLAASLPRKVYLLEYRSGGRRVVTALAAAVR